MGFIDIQEKVFWQKGEGGETTIGVQHSNYLGVYSCLLELYDLHLKMLSNELCNKNL